MEDSFNMKKLIFNSSISFGQIKHRVVNGEIVQSGLPEVFTRPNGELFLGGYSTRTDLHYEDGWRDEVLPEYNPDVQKLGERYYDSDKDIVTYQVINKTQEELDSEKLNLIEIHAELTDNAFNSSLLKKLLSTQINSIPEEEVIEFRTLFNSYRIGVYLKKDDKIYYPLNDKLYKVLQPHTTSLEWTPDTAVSLYVEITPPGVIAAWKQPLGAHDAYQIGDKVTHNGKTWECTVADNTWEPGVYGWVEIT